jgi:PAS domain S-box-containing protein
MNWFSHIYDLQYALNALAVVACWLLCAEYIVIVRIRKPPYPWSSYSVSFVLFALACDRLLKISQPHEISSIWQLVSQCLLNLLLLLAALMIPTVRKATYKRPRFNQLEEIYKNLKYSQRLFQSYLDEAPVLAYIKDKDRRITHANAGFVRLFGESWESVLGKTDLWGEPESSQARDLQILAGNGEKELTETVPLKDGTCTILDIRFPLNGPENERLLGGIAVDITNQLKRKNRIEVLASIVDLCPDAIYSQDESGRILTWNPAAQAMFGYSSEEIVGQSAAIITVDNNQDELLRMVDSFHHNPASSQQFESYRVGKDGSRRAVLVAAAYVPGVQPTIAVITRDITLKKEVEEQIRALHDALEVKVQELSVSNVSLQKARDQALEAAGAKSAFVANASHELRTPLSGILGMSELLAQQPLDQDSQKLVALLQHSSQDLMQVIEDILDLAKLEAGKTTLDEEVFSLADLLRDCCLQFAPTLATKMVTWQSFVANDVPDLICTDRAAIKRILSNFVTNAVGHTTSGGISISVTLVHGPVRGPMQDFVPDDTANLTLKFAVSDTGVGIDKDVLPLLFTPFARVSKSTEGVAGKGLGLVLCKQLTDLLQGQIGCTSEKEKGSTFWFTALVQKAEVSSSTVPQRVGVAVPPMLPHELAKYAVLSVDDSPIVSRLTIRQLELLGVQAKAALTGSEAIEKAERDCFDVILMDVYLPDMTGYQAAKEIRRLEQFQGKSPSVIIALTGCDIDELREQADSAVMDDILEKPINIELLRTSLLRALVRRGERRSQSDETSLTAK